LCSHSIVSQHFMESEGSLLRSQKLPICPVLSQTNPVHTSSYFYKIHLNLIHPPTSWSSWWSLSGFPTYNLHPFLFSPICATCIAHLIPYLIILTILGDELKSCHSLLCSFLHLPIISSLFGPNGLLSNLFSNTPSQCFSLVRGLVSHPYRTTDKIIVLYILIFKLFESRQKSECSGLNGSKHYQTSVSS
jgi:hypothetical protein